MPSNDEPAIKIKDIILIISALGGSLGISAINQSNEDPRPDPFYGREGRALENRIEKLEEKIDNLNSEVNELKFEIIQWRRHYNMLGGKHDPANHQHDQDSRLP